ncbi:retrovirus-related pol polyprotein from transposon TNT 1-94 [Tanacetum coccineum]
MAFSATATPAILVFSGTHYHIWAVKMKTYLKSQGLWKVVETDESIPALGENPTVAQLRTYETESLKKDKALTCTDRGKAVRLLTLKREFELLRMKDDVKYYSARMMDVVNQTRLHGEVVKDQKVAEKMMISVPPNKLQAQEQRVSIRSKEKVKGIFEYLLEVTRLEIQNKTLSEEEISAKGTTKVQPHKTLLPHQRKFGHLEKYCRIKKARNNIQGVQQANVSKEDQVDDEHLFMASHLDKHPDSLTWLMDSGCTSHMTPERSFFISLDTKDNPRVKLGDGRYTRAKGRGTIAINTKKGTKYISRVLYVPELDRSMLSVPQMIKNGYGVNFKNDTQCVITDSRDVKIATFDMENDSYYLKLDVADASAFSVTEDDSMKWHKRFGHFNYRTLQHMYSTKLVRDMPPISEVDSKYEGCELGKSRRLPFSKVGVTRATHKLEIMHSDICGPMSTHLGAKLVEVQSGSTLRILRTDNGGEYTSNEFEYFLRQQGVIHQVTVPYSPQQNGVSERKNRTIVEMARSMLYEKKLPKTFWAKAVATSVYLLNRLATKAVSGKTPIEAWSGIKPSIQHLKVFGSISYYHIPDIKRSKLDAKARKGIFVGYATESKGYRIYDLTDSKIVISRDVTFDEGAYWDWNMDEVKRHEDTFLNETYHDKVDIPEFDIEDTSDTDVLRTRRLIDVYKTNLK